METQSQPRRLGPIGNIKFGLMQVRASQGNAHPSTYQMFSSPASRFGFTADETIGRSRYIVWEKCPYRVADKASALCGKAGAMLNAHTESRTKRQRSAREAMYRNRPILGIVMWQAKDASTEPHLQTRAPRWRGATPLPAAPAPCCRGTR